MIIFQRTFKYHNLLCHELLCTYCKAILSEGLRLSLDTSFVPKHQTDPSWTIKFSVEIPFYTNLWQFLMLFSKWNIMYVSGNKADQAWQSLSDCILGVSI